MNCIAALSKALQEFPGTHLSSASTEEISAERTSKSTPGDNNKIGPATEENTVTGLTSVREETDLGFEILDKQDINDEFKGNNVKEQDDMIGVKLTFDDLRAGPFKYVMISGMDSSI